MNKLIYLTIFIILLSACGKVTHQISSEPVEIIIPTDYNVATSVAIKKMYEEWIYVCNQTYPINSVEHKKCKESAVDLLLTTIDEINRSKVENGN